MNYTNKRKEKQKQSKTKQNKKEKKRINNHLLLNERWREYLKGKVFTNKTTINEENNNKTTRKKNGVMGEGTRKYTQ
jgi:hypothetical protein